MIKIIVNSRSKKSLVELEKIERDLKRKKLEYKVLKTSKNKNASDLMNEIRGDELIVIGGDGTINEVVNNYHGQEFIYLAYGSGNDLARSIKFDKTVKISKLLDSKKFIDENGFTFPVYYDLDRSLINAFKIKSVPYNLKIQNSVIQDIQSGVVSYDKLSELFSSRN